MDEVHTIGDRLTALLGGRPGIGIGIGIDTGIGIGIVEHISDLGRSHEWTLHRARLTGGREVFVKAAAGPHGALRAEREGLRWLREADGAPVPEVIAADDTMLVLPWLERGSPDRAAAERFGRELARLHSSDPGGYGAPWPGFIGPLPLDNSSGPDATRSWPRWFAERRLEPYLRDAHGVLGSDGVRLIEQVIDRIEDLAGPPEPPSRIHGDLWSGNVLWSGGRGLLIDPAAHGGHRETDLAMLDLFGAPFLDTITSAYAEAAPLAAGWRSRTPLHQLHPLLVHVVLFGGGYAAQTMSAARAALSAAG